MKRIRLAAVTAMALGAIFVVGGTLVSSQSRGRLEIPTFEYDATWPKPLPNNWITGNIGAMTSDAQGHIWVAQRPGSTTNLSERFGLDRRMLFSRAAGHGVRLRRQPDSGVGTHPRLEG
jgi:hypothetical protein